MNVTLVDFGYPVKAKV